MGNYKIYQTWAPWGMGWMLSPEFFLLYQQALFWETVTHIQEQKLQRVSN
ncbi:hemolysin, chromosomal domain protein [Escherichia coli 95.1288]|nr:hemolysin [Escherichia coli FDA506]EKK88900.1 hemolysin, chromosomal domain protein [Escherichia coli 10.0821]EKW22257.1 hemolysin, chromosomal domain protein [Escherichia coli 95.1288]